MVIGYLVIGVAIGLIIVYIDKVLECFYKCRNHHYQDYLKRQNDRVNSRT